MKGVSLVLLFCGALGAQPASVEGTVIHAASGQPMGGVHVRLFTGNYEGATAAYGAISDRNGHFSMARVEPGTYIVDSRRTGFVLLRVGAGERQIPTVILKPGQRLTDLKLEMTLRAVIAGRVLDESGDPVANVPVLVEPTSPDSPSGGILGRTSTDDRGEFRIPGKPGKFRVKAMPYDRPAEMQEVRTDGSVDARYGPTYYPNTAKLRL